MLLLIAALVARVVLAAVLVVAGSAKLRNTDSTREMLAGFGVERSLLTVAALALPLFELVVAAALIVPSAAFAGASAALALLVLFTGVIMFNLSRGRHPVCNCFGQLDPAPIGPKTLIRNAGLTGLALLIVAAGPRAAATWRLDIVFGVTPLTALAGVAALSALVLLLWIAVAQMTILRRLARMKAASPPGAALRAIPTESRGLPEGSLAPSFGLSDTRGDFVTLEQLLAPGRPVILYFTKPDCPPCAAMADEVDRWQRNHAGLVEVIRIGYGLGAIEHYALLQLRGEVANAYDCWGTPCAVLVMPDGRIGSLAAQGAAAIRALVKRAVAGASEDRFKIA